MKRWSRALAYLWSAAVVIAACTSQPSKEVAAAGVVTTRETRLAAALADSNGPAGEPLARWVLPNTLREISGVTLVDHSRLLAHGDERGVIWSIDYRSGVVLKRFSVGTPVLAVDLEGIAHVGKQVFVLGSSGKLFEFREGANGDHVRYTMHDTKLGRECVFEGVAFDPGTNSLLLACKHILKKSLGDGLLIYRWKLDGDGDRLSSVSVPLAAAVGDNGWTTLRPSDIAVDPGSGNYVLVASQQKALIVVTPAGEVVRSEPLPKGHAQPEGLAITPDSILVICDEAGTTPAATLTLYRWR